MESASQEESLDLDAHVETGYVDREFWPCRVTWYFPIHGNLGYANRSVPESSEYMYTSNLTT